MYIQVKIYNDYVWMYVSPFGLVKLKMNQANIYHISNHCNVHTKVSKKIWHYLTSISGLSHNVVYEWMVLSKLRMNQANTTHISNYCNVHCTYKSKYHKVASAKARY